VNDVIYLSRARIRRNLSVSALLPLLQSKGKGSQHTGHHLMWSLFADGPDRRRDFLWREMAQSGTFLTLSARPPAPDHDIFEIDEPKPFAPALATGDRLRFSLRANPVVRRRRSGGGRSGKHDVVMDALARIPRDDRGEQRLSIMREQGFAWLERQGVSSGFGMEPKDITIDGYQQHRIRKRGGATMSFSTLDFEGVLTVHDPTALLEGIARGFGASKAYGCGLMLIRRA
jgi:CRISPR system Cascade subunit CasE